MFPSMCAAAPVLTSPLSPEENRQHPGANERQVEYYEERQYEYENFAEEQIDGESS